MLFPYFYFTFCYPIQLINIQTNINLLIIQLIFLFFHTKLNKFSIREVSIPRQNKW